MRHILKEINALVEKPVEQDLSWGNGMSDGGFARPGRGPGVEGFLLFYLLMPFSGASWSSREDLPVAS